MTENPLQAGRAFGRAAGIFLLHLLAATFGPAAFESLLWSVIGQPHSLSALEGREWILSVTSAALIGYFASKRWPNKAAMWVWTLPVALLIIRIALYGSTSRSAVAGGSAAKHFLHPDCSRDIAECQDFLVVTVLSIRAVAYSVAAAVSARLSRTQATSP
jgi:hypothetical protein